MGVWAGRVPRLKGEGPDGTSRAVMWQGISGRWGRSSRPGGADHRHGRRSGGAHARTRRGGHPGPPGTAGVPGGHRRAAKGRQPAGRHRRADAEPPRPTPRAPQRRRPCAASRPPRRSSASSRRRRRRARCWPGPRLSVADAASRHRYLQDSSTFSWARNATGVPGARRSCRHYPSPLAFTGGRPARAPCEQHLLAMADVASTYADTPRVRQIRNRPPSLSVHQG